LRSRATFALVLVALVTAACRTSQV
jgi:predicted small secreted protein